MAPEYFMHGIVHEQTDVFAFGVILLELITGRRAVDSRRQSLVKWVCLINYLFHLMFFFSSINSVRVPKNRFEPTKGFMHK